MENERMEVGVSVVCLAYNAEKYIAQCLDGFVMQKCNFPFEVFVHDDASTDHTADIIRQYEAKYPEIIHAIYQSQNQYSQGVIISRKFIYPKVKGKYIALCEGDDYWTDELKLQKQFDAMEAHPDCMMSVHRVHGVKEDNSARGIEHPNFIIESGVIKSRDFIDYNCTNDYVFQTSSYFMNAKHEIAYQIDEPEFKKASSTGDFARMMYFATLGNIYYINEFMSCYRYGSTSSAARMDLQGRTEKRIQAHYKKQIRMMEEFDKYTNGQYHDLCVRKINGYLFDKAVRNRDYREMLKKQYRFYLNKYSAKERMKITGYAYFPHLVALADLIRRK